MVTLPPYKKTDLDQFLMVFLKTNIPCHSCQLLQICIPDDMPLALLDALQKAVDQNQHLDKGEILVRQGDDLHYLYAPQTGSLKAWRVDESGAEHVIDFYFPGELIGLEAISGKKHLFNISALESSTFCKINYSKLTEIIEKQPSLQTHLLSLTSYKLGTYARLLSHDAETRLLDFLIHLRQRLKKESAPQIQLSMSRADLGHYLNLTPETISRLFTRLQHQGLLCAHGKKITFLSS